MRRISSIVLSGLFLASPVFAQSPEAIARCRAQPKPFQPECFRAIGAPNGGGPLPLNAPGVVPPPATVPVALPPSQTRIERLAEDGGYQSIAFDDFILDGKKFAVSERKLLLRGYYKKSGQVEYLYADNRVLMARQDLTKPDLGIGLLSEDAARDIRVVFLNCQRHPALSEFGCPVKLLGHATTCEMTTLVGHRALPCLAIEDGEVIQ